VRASAQRLQRAESAFSADDPFDVPLAPGATTVLATSELPRRSAPVRSPARRRQNSARTAGDANQLSPHTTRPGRNSDRAVDSGRSHRRLREIGRFGAVSIHLIGAIREVGSRAPVPGEWCGPPWFPTAAVRLSRSERVVREPWVLDRLAVAGASGLGLLRGQRFRFACRLPRV
jgi:hypothetical protein